MPNISFKDKFRSSYCRNENAHCGRIEHYQISIIHCHLIIYGSNVPDKVSNQKYFIFRPHLTSVSALPGEK